MYEGFVENMPPAKTPVTILIKPDPGEKAMTQPGDCPDFRVSENGTVPFTLDAGPKGTIFVERKSGQSP